MNTTTITTLESPNPYRESSLGWLLWEHGWRPLPAPKSAHPQWERDGVVMTASEAQGIVFEEMRREMKIPPVTVML